MDPIYKDSLYRMLKARGYNISEDQVDTEFEVDDLFVTFRFLEEKPGIAPIKALVNSKKKDGIKSILIILGRYKPAHGTTDYVRAIRKELDVEFFPEQRLLIDIDHYFQPKWEKMTAEEKEDVALAYYLVDTDGNFNFNKTPLLFESDPVAVYYKAIIDNVDVEGDLFRVKRKDNSFNYRYARKDFI